MRFVVLLVLLKSHSPDVQQSVLAWLSPHAHRHDSSCKQAFETTNWKIRFICLMAFKEMAVSCTNQRFCQSEHTEQPGWRWVENAPCRTHAHSTQAGVHTLGDIFSLLLYLQWAAQASLYDLQLGLNAVYLTAVRLPACGAHRAFHNFPRIFFLGFSLNKEKQRFWCISWSAALQEGYGP